MRSFSAVWLGSCLLMAAGCTDDRILGGHIPDQTDAASITARGPGAAAAFRLAVSEAERRALHGDSGMLLAVRRARLAPQLAATATDAALPDPENPETWGRTTIQNPIVIVSIGEQQFIWGSMHHDGHFGEIEFDWTLRGPTGAVVTSGRSERFIDFQPFAWPGRLAWFTASVALSLGHACGRTLEGRGAFASFWGPLPEIRLKTFTLPTVRLGYTAASAYHTDSEPPCAEDPPPDGDGDGDGTTGGGDTPTSGETYARYACYYKDWYFPDGSYWFTEELGCYLVAVYNDE